MHRRSCLSIICIHRTTELFWSSIAMSERDGVLMVLAGMRVLAKKKTSGSSQNQSPCDERVVVTAKQPVVCAAPGVAVELCRRFMVAIAEPSFAIAGTPCKCEASQIGSRNAGSACVSHLSQTTSGTSKPKRLHYLPSRLGAELSLAARWPVCECQFACVAFVCFTAIQRRAMTERRHIARSSSCVELKGQRIRARDGDGQGEVIEVSDDWLQVRVNNGINWWYKHHGLDFSVLEERLWLRRSKGF